MREGRSKGRELRGLHGWGEVGRSDGKELSERLKFVG